MQTASITESRKSSTAARLLYRPLDFVTVRAPLLPVEWYRSLTDEEDWVSRLADPRVRRALAVGSTSLLGTVQRFKQFGLSQRDAELMRAKLLRYQIRMSTRPTPFGLFAGVALATWGDVTDLAIRSACALTRTRPDMAWLMAFVVSAETNPAIRRQLSFWANPLAVIEAGRVALAERAPTAKAGPGQPVSVRATNAVKRALSLARRPVPYDVLLAQLSETIPAATPEKVEKLLTELWEQTFLLTDLRPPLTSQSPARYVSERLSRIPEASSERSRLEAFLNAISAWDHMEPEASVEAFGALLAEAGASPDKSRETPLQVDMAMSVEGQLGHSLAIEAARAAELLLRISPFPPGLSSLTAYRQTFLGRYGNDREVPVLELLDPQRGLGLPSGHAHGTGGDSARAAERAQTLLQLACSALHNRDRVVQLDESHLKRLETWLPDKKNAPLSLDINILVAAGSRGAIDSGDFTVIVGPNLGGMAAGRNLARFADILGSDGLEALKQGAAAEQAQTPEHLWAELVYLPANLRSANVVIRPPVRDHEIVFGVSAGVSAANVIPLDELVVGVDHGSFYVRWPAAGKRVTFSSGNMLNLHNAPPVGRFLVDVSNDGKAIFSTFDWSLVENFPYLPRVQAGHIVLRTAQWRIHKDDLNIKTPDDYRRSLDFWRAEWDVPQHVFLSIGDNRLVIDLDQEAQAAELKTELKKLSEGGSLIVQEVLPRLDEAWLTGAEGHYYSEFTVSLVLREDLSPAKPNVARTEHMEAPVVAVLPKQADRKAQRNFPPGSEWLFVKIYCPRNLEENVISGSMFTFAENVTASGLADSWFFIRYSDPDPHLRLRFHGSPERLTSQLFGHVCDWASGLMSDELCLRFAFDTYEQETERFGGPAGMAIAEALFAADSRCAAELLRHSGDKQWSHDRTTLVAVSIDELLRAMGFDDQERLRWYRAQATLGRAETSSEYRQRKTLFRSLLGNSESLAHELGGVEIANLFEARRRLLSPLAGSLRELAARGELDQSLDALCVSFVHLHANRLGGQSSLSEQWLLSLLQRTREGLQKSPTQPQVRE